VALQSDVLTENEVQAGKMDRRIRVELATEVDAPSGSGQKVLTWALFFRAWAEKRDLRGTELFQAQQVAAKVTTTFRIRWRAGVNPGRNLRLIDESDGNRVYDITAAPELGRREGLELMAWARAEA